MKKIAVVSVFCSAAALWAYHFWSQPPQIKHCTSDDLMDLTCKGLSERHEDFIAAYHDDEIAYRRRTGSFHADLGLPLEDTLPMVVLMKQVMQDNHIAKEDLESLSVPAMSLQRSDFYYEISAACALSPDAKALDVIKQAARNLNLMN